MKKTAGCVAFLLIAGAFGTAGAGVLSDLHVRQAVAERDSVCSISPQIEISFTVAKAAPVTVHIERHQNEMMAWNGPYLVETCPVRTLEVGELAAGQHSVVWDGLNADGEEVTYAVSVPAGTINREKRDDPAKFVERVRADLLKIVVQTGNERRHVNYRRKTGHVDANLKIHSFKGAVADSAGRAVLPVGGTGYRFSADWAEEVVHNGAGQSASPSGSFDVAVDSHGDAFIINHVGVYRFSQAGPPVSWKADHDYINYPYPSDYRTLLGMLLDRNARGAKKKYVFGPGGNGHYKYWDTDEMYGKPGFSLKWRGVAVDKADNVYVAGADPANIQVFNNDGDHLRTLKLPDGIRPGVMRFGTDGTLWTAAESGVHGLDPQTGAVRKQLTEERYRFIFVDLAGNIYLATNKTVARFNAAGEPLPFAAESPYRGEKPNTLELAFHRYHVPREAYGFLNEIGGIFVAHDGSLYASEAHSGRLLHFTPNGIYQPLPLAVAPGQHEPGNIFLDEAPAAFDLFITNFSPEPRNVTVDWTLTDFEGHQQRGETPLRLSPAARQTARLVVPASQNGHYRLYAEVRLNGRVYGTLKTMLARIPSRRIYEDRYSPFAMCWGNNFPLMAYAGVKSHRGDSASWAHCLEPRDGLLYPQRDDGQNFSDGLEGPRRFARRWGICKLNGLDYGEAWLGNYDLISRIWSYDRFYGYVLHVLDTFAGKGEMFYQFWNEPNFFWHVPGPFGREHYGLLTKQLWCMIKARDKDALAIPDGDAGGIGMMEEMAEWGVAPYNDGVQFHYPGARPITMNDMPVPDAPEGKLPMCRSLIELRDELYPGKPAWNTEEGWWGLQVKPWDIGAIMVPRTCISQIAAGIDKIYWFMSVREDPTYLMTSSEEPHPTYVSYATMTRLLDASVYAGTADLGPGNYAYLFARENSMVLAAWRLKGEANVTLPVGVGEAPVTDIMGRTRKVAAADGNLSLALTDHVQYLELPRNEWTLAIARGELNALLKKAGVVSAAEIAAAVGTIAPKAATDGPSMTRVYYLVKAAEMAVITGDAPAVRRRAAQVATSARQAVTDREGRDGYLRQARVALEWVDRLATRPLIAGNTWAVELAAEAVKTIAAIEPPCYPGAVVDAFIGEPGEVARIRAIQPKERDYSTTIDEKFRFQIDRKPGDSFDLELTVWNFYRHTIAGTVRPRLPEGWQASRQAIDFSLEPGTRERALLSVTISPGTRPGVHSVGGTTILNGRTVAEIHPQRVNVQE